MNDDDFMVHFGDNEVSGIEADDNTAGLHKVDESFLDMSVNEEATPAKFTIIQRPVCGECGKELGNMSSLRRHMKTHLPGLIRCSGCNQYFASDEEKQQHMTLKHSNNICNICGKTYKRVSDLNIHQKSHHESTVAKFKCPFDGCNKTFSKQTFYEDHLNSHTGEEPYQCESCGTRFKSRYERNSHFKLCIGLQKIECEICQQTFTHRASLYNHKAAKHSDKKLGDLELLTKT